MRAGPVHIVKRTGQKRLRIRLRGLRRKKSYARMGKQAAFACLKLLFAHHAHGHLAPIRMKGSFSEHTNASFPLW